MVGQSDSLVGVFVCVGLFFFMIGYFMGVYKVLDFMSQTGIVFGVMAFLLVLTVISVI